MTNRIRKVNGIVKDDLFFVQNMGSTSQEVFSLLMVKLPKSSYDPS